MHIPLFISTVYYLDICVGSPCDIPLLLAISPSSFTPFFNRSLLQSIMETANSQESCGEVRARGPSSKFIYTRRGPRRHYFTHDAEIWDEAPKIYLNKLALREIDRRNAWSKRPMKIVKEKLKTNNLSRFARRGGPDLSHLRGVSLTSLLPYHSIQKRRRRINNGELFIFLSSLLFAYAVSYISAHISY